MSEVVAPKPLRIIPWPKMYFLWPTAAVAVLMAVLNFWFKTEEQQEVWGAIFLLVLGINLTILTFDFPRATSFMVFLAVVALGTTAVLINQYYNIVEPIRRWVTERHIVASTEFYAAFAVVYCLLWVGMWIVTRFDYWELSANEIVHHHGMMGDVERYSTSGLRMHKEITDVFEWAMSGAGRITLDIHSLERPVVLDNVPRINWVAQKFDEMLEANVVRIEGMPDAKEKIKSGERHIPE